MSKRMGRPQIGESRSLRLTLPPDVWVKVDESVGDGKLAEWLRVVVTDAVEGVQVDIFDAIQRARAIDQKVDQ